MRPISTTGHSTRPAISASRGWSSTTSRPWAKASWVASCQTAVGALGGVEQDEGAAEFGGVVLEAGDLERGGGHEAVAAGEVAGGDAVDGEGHDLGAGLGGEEAEDRVQRADPAQGAVAPAHGFRPGEGADHRLDGFGDDLGGGAAGLQGDGEPDLGLLVVADFELVAGQAGGAEETGERGFGGVGARALAFLAQAGGMGGEAFERQGQAARGREGGGVGVGEAALDQAIGDQAAQVVGGLCLHARGDFLGEEFEQQVGHQGVQRLRKPWVTRALAISTKSAETNGSTMKAVWQGP